jgi:DNA uptake protein ComE-like DNA-binding protein
MFNPNTSSEEEFIALGFKAEIASRIINYRSKGGVFRIKDDLYRIYNIDSSLVDTLYSFIDLPKRIKRKPLAVHEYDTLARHKTVYKLKEVELPDFDINMADTSMLQTINGIGSVLSNRIIEYRDNLGGIIDLNQLYEVYNLDSLVVEKLLDKTFISNEFEPKLLMINRLSEKQLAAHPYISWRQARLIIAYRNQHGDFITEDDLLKVYSVNREIVKKMKPYLKWTPAN